MSTPCRILDDKELEGLQWRKDAEELRVNNIFGSQKTTAKLPFTQKSKKEIRYFQPQPKPTASDRNADSYTPHSFRGIRGSYTKP